MAYAVSTGYRLAANAETVWGTPVTTGAKYVRINDSNFKPDLAFTESQEINASHRQTADTVMTSAKGSGSFTQELSYESPDLFLQSLFGAAFTGSGTRTLKIGQTVRPITFQEQWSDLTNVFKVYRGAFVNSWNLTIQVGQILTSGFNFVSKTPTSETATQIGTVAAANTNPVINPLADVRVLQEGSTPATITGVSSINLTVENDITEFMVLGSAAPDLLAPARIRVKGSLKVFKQDAALFAKLMAGTASSLIVKVGGASAKNYEVTVVNLKYTGEDGGQSGSNAVTETYNFDGLYEATDSALKIVATD